MAGYINQTSSQRRELQTEDLNTKECRRGEPQRLIQEWVLAAGPPPLPLNPAAKRPGTWKQSHIQRPLGSSRELSWDSAVHSNLTGKNAGKVLFWAYLPSSFQLSIPNWLNYKGQSLAISLAWAIQVSFSRQGPGRGSRQISKIKQKLSVTQRDTQQHVKRSNLAFWDEEQAFMRQWPAEA